MTEKRKILVVDDEKNILEVVSAYLKKEGYEVATATDGETAISAVKSENIHLVILDLMLPKISGEEVCKKIRAFSEIPIIMLTAKVDEEDKIEGISIGADDYMTKPFGVRELVARVGALLRRSYRDTIPLSDILSFDSGKLEVDIKKMIVNKDHIPINLTTNEFKVLLTLINNPGQVFSREQLLERAFGLEYEGFDRTVDTYIKNIRQKIEDDPKAPKYIGTIYGMGYKFIGD